MMPNNQINGSAQAAELLDRQLAVWPLAAQNYQALQSVEVRMLVVGGDVVHIQFNPARIASAGARVDAQSLKERPCFLCPGHLPDEQIRLAFGSDYLFLCNPYPIFPAHFTVSTLRHTEQMILKRLPDFLELARRLEAFTVFYNGPRCGASAPDHAHFQVVTRSVMPLDDAWKGMVAEKGRLLREAGSGQLFLLTHCLRNGFVIRAQQEADILSLFRTVCQAMDVEPDEYEPKMNLFGYYVDKGWTLILIPRRQHRPAYFFKEGAERILTSPGGADIGGLFITAREEDFVKVTPAILQDIYTQVCLSDTDMERIVERMNGN